MNCCAVCGKYDGAHTTDCTTIARREEPIAIDVFRDIRLANVNLTTNAYGESSLQAKRALDELPKDDSS